MTDLIIAGRAFSSRLIVGTGKYSSPAVMVKAHEASGADMITVAVRRVNISDRSKESLLDYIDTSKYFLLPNTAGCYTADEAVRTARLGREAGLSDWVKLEVIGDERTLFPDNEGLLEATRVLVAEGFVVLPYTTDDPVVCRKLEDAGAAAVMPLAAPIGSGLGIQNANNLRIIREFARVPLIVDAGVGTASDAALAMELGADGVLMNTAIAGADDPIAMAKAMKLAVEAGRHSAREEFRERCTRRPAARSRGWWGDNQLGIYKFFRTPLPTASDRRPVWPAGRGVQYTAAPARVTAPRRSAAR
jgi:thiazole synthase